MIPNCLAGGANARLLQGAQRNLRGTAGHSQQGLAQGSKQDNTIKHEFGGEPALRPPEQHAYPDGQTNKALEVLALGQTRQSSGLKRSQAFRHRHSATMAQTASTNPNGHAPCKKP